MKQAMFPRLLMLACFSMLGFGLIQAQTSKTALEIGIAPKPGTQQVDRTAPPKTTAKESRMLEEQAIVRKLVVEMTANQHNPAYDMAASLAKLQKSPYVIYPLNHFDPEFPIVYRTGDPKADLAAYQKAKEHYLAKQ